MSRNDWSRAEVEATVDDYLRMLASHLAQAPYNKAEHRRKLVPKLNGRSPQSVEYKHGNISAVLIKLRFPPIPGYKPRWNYQRLLAEVVEQRLDQFYALHQLAAADADRPMIVPEVQDFLAVVSDAPHMHKTQECVSARTACELEPRTNYLEREARNQSLGKAGEEFVLQYERMRLVAADQERLAAKIEHTAAVRGDREGYDILSFEVTGEERLIEVKTTKYGKETPFFLSRNEVTVSKREERRYFLYRMFLFNESPGLYKLRCAMEDVCSLSPTTYIGVPR